MIERNIVIDGNSLMHRAFYALPLLQNTKGLYTNAIYGFMNMLFKVIENYSPTYIIVAFDRKVPTFRHLEYMEYKAGRKKTPEELIPQFPILKEILHAMNILILEIDGYEADDILGTVSKCGEEKGIDTLIITGDRDAFQLISKNTHVLFTRKGVTEADEYDEIKFHEVYGLLPAQMIHVKGLMGDASDNIPGVPGIGEKTAIKLIKEYGSIENVLEHTSEITGNKLRESLIQYADQALFSKKLATIFCDVPIKVDFYQCKYRLIPNDHLKELLINLEFKSILEKLKFSQDKDDMIPLNILHKTEYIIDSSDKLAKMCDHLLKVKKFSFSIVPKFSIAVSKEEQYHILIKENLIDIGLELEEVLFVLKEILENVSIKKIVHDGKALLSLLKKYGISFEGLYFDTMIAAYLIDPARAKYTVLGLIQKHVSVLINEINATDLFSLYEKMDVLLHEYGLKTLYEDIELPLVQVLYDMETEGFSVNVDELHKLGKEFAGQIQQLTTDIFDIAGESFNINSTKQLGVILFEKMKLPTAKKTKTGYSTDIEVLEQLEPHHIIISRIIEYRQLNKLKSTYIDGLLNVVDLETHKIHTSFNQTVTATGRISSTEPNLQNIPIKTEIGRKIRKVFIATGQDFLLVDADYSQIELRVLAHIADDPVLIDAFIQNQDIHKRTAAEVFKIDMEQVTTKMRSRAKAVNFGIVYGISEFGLARNLNISHKEAAEYIGNYLFTYKGVKKYMENIVQLGKLNGYVTTLMNRRRYLPEFSSHNHNIKSFGERIAMNTPIQGTAADIIKKAMIDVHHELKKRSLKSRLILQVHDELIINTHKDELEEVKKIIKDKMESVVALKVPLEVDIGVGDNWYTAK